MTQFRITLEGTAPLLMHNARLADPLDPVVKEKKKLTGKIGRNKTDDDHEEIQRLEYVGGLYIDPDVGPYLPGQNIQRCLLDAARLTRQGKKIERGVSILTEINPLAYQGPRDEGGLWADRNFRHLASITTSGKQRTMRCRPMFRTWRTQAEGILDSGVIDLADLEEIAAVAGRLVGIGDWRPRFGRFEASIARVGAERAA